MKDWAAVWQIYSSVREMALPERQSFLDSVGTDPEILRQVVLLLEQSEAQTFASVESAPPPVPSPKQSRGEHWFGKFEITGSLGRGGMGEVFAARDIELGRNVALKFLTLNPTPGSKGAERLLREAQTVSALNHPNIVTIYEVIRSESSVAIVMELVEGRSARDFCKQPVSTAEAVAIGRQIAQALVAAHAHGIVHRDIKPENIMVRPDGGVKILDFGLARELTKPSDNFSDVLPQGTLRYMSPEQVRCEPASAASDVFSLGLVLYELLTGHHPFRADNPVETARRIVVDTPGELPKQVPAGLRRLIESMLAKNSSQRPSAGHVAAQLDLILDGSRKVGLRANPLRGRSWALIIAALGIAVAIFRYAPDKRHSGELTDLVLTPLTSQPGWERAPAVSPQGDAIAFTWSPTLDAPAQLYVKRQQDAEPLQLTASRTASTGFLAWSPDGKRIAFKRLFDPGGAIYSIDSAGGGERKIVDLANVDLSSSIDWSPDGKLLAYTNPTPGIDDRPSIYVYELETDHKRQITKPSVGMGDWSPKFSPDGKTMAFKRVMGVWADDIYFVPVGGGEVRRFTTLQRSIWEHAWMPDGKSLLISCQCRGTVHGIWRFPLDAPEHPERVMQSSIDTITPSVARQTGKIAWVNHVSDLNIYRVATTRNAKPERLVASTGRDDHPAYAPDGRIAWTSDRSGSREVWIARQDGSGQKQITHLSGPNIEGLQWSFDGRYLAFDSRFQNRRDIFLLQCSPGTLQCGEPYALNIGPAEYPGWSADSRSIYFASDRSGRLQICKRDLAGGNPVVITQFASSIPRESPDGKWLYFYDVDKRYISRMPVTRGAPQPQKITPLIDADKGVPYNAWAVTDSEVVFVARSAVDRPASIRAYSLSTGKVRSVLDLTEALITGGDIGLSVSRDGKSILFTQLDRSGSNIIIAEKSREFR